MRSSLETVQLQSNYEDNNLAIVGILENEPTMLINGGKLIP